MSVIIRMGLIPSGQTVGQAPQVVQDQSVSAAMTSPCTSPATPAVLSSATRSCTTLRGESGLPASNAGQASSQRPQETQASSSTSCRAREVGQLRDADLAGRFDFFHGNRRHHAEGVVADGEIHRAGQRMEQAGVGHQGDEAQGERGMAPPKCEVPGHGAGGVDAGAAEKLGGDVANGRQTRQRRVGEDDAQAFDDVPRDADGDEQDEDADVGRAARKAAVAAQAADKQHRAADEKRDAEGVHRQFEDAEVHALVEHRIVGLAPEQVGEHMLDRHQRRAHEQDNEAAEQQLMGKAGPRPAVSQAALKQHVVEQTAAGKSDVDGRAVASPLSPESHPADDAVNPRRHRRGGEQVKRRLRPAGDVAENLPGQRRRGGQRELSGRRQRHDGPTSRSTRAPARTRRRPGQSRPRRRSAPRGRC